MLDAFNREDPSTWVEANWPSNICRNGGFMGRFPYIKRIKLPQTLLPEQPAAWENRQNEDMYNVFKNCIGAKRLWVSIDRYGIMRPTRLNVDGVEEVKYEWKTKKDWIHWDLSPFHYGTSAAGYAPSKISHDLLCKEYGMRRVQALVTISDCPEEVGGFHCVPGFHGERYFGFVALIVDSLNGEKSTWMGMVASLRYFIETLLRYQMMTQ